jgi:hypothetical protein
VKTDDDFIAPPDLTSLNYRHLKYRHLSYFFLSSLLFPITILSFLLSIYSYSINYPSTMTSSLEQLKATGTVVVCDSGEFHPWVAGYCDRDRLTDRDRV